MARKYTKDASIHTISINHVLKTIKSNIMANFICVKNKDIVISTNNVALPSDLQEIKKCVKSLLLNDTDQISSPRLSQSKSYLKIVEISTWTRNQTYTSYLKTLRKFSRAITFSMTSFLPLGLELSKFHKNWTWPSFGSISGTHKTVPRPNQSLTDVSTWKVSLLWYIV